MIAKNKNVEANVESSAIHRVELRDQLMPIWFPDGSCYDHTDVSQRVYDDFMAAKSKGVYYKKHIRGKYHGVANHNRMPDGK